MLDSLFRSAVLTIFSLSVLNTGAQQRVKVEQAPPEIKVESFDWYLKPLTVEPRVPDERYYHGSPDGESANRFPRRAEKTDVDGPRFVYTIRVRNVGDRAIVLVVWRYDFFDPLTHALSTRHEFETRTHIKPGKRKTLYAESGSPPTPVVEVRSLLLDERQPPTETASVASVTFDQRPQDHEL